MDDAPRKDGLANRDVADRGVVDTPQGDQPSRQAPAEASRERIARVVLEETSGLRLSPTVEAERRSAMHDLLDENSFALKEEARGPYVLHLRNDGERLSFIVCDEMDLQVTRFSLPLGYLRPVIKEYFLVCDSYFTAIKSLTPKRIEAIDMGRRGLHNDGAELLRQCLADRVEMDKSTARRLFTLICVLHIRR